MSSSYRDVGEAHAQTYRMIPSNLDALSVKELKELLQVIREDAGGYYADYAVFMGWHDNHKEAMQSLSSEESIELSVKHSIPIKSLIEITDWLSEKRGLPVEFFTTIYGENSKAYQTEHDWIPKSQIASKRDVLFHGFAPHECVPWFKSILAVGHLVRLTFNGGIGGYFNVEGIVEKIDSPEIYINGQSYMMGNVVHFTRFANEKG